VAAADTSHDDLLKALLTLAQSSRNAAEIQK